MDDRDSLNRRRFLAAATATLATLPAGRTKAAESRAPLSEDEPDAKALAYYADAARVDVRLYPSYRRGQSCTTCAQIEFGTGRQRPCKIIPGRLVNAGGWCKVWIRRGG
jgi:hypothetical protein